MDGNLLDPDNADATLAKEWSLPELPPGAEEKQLLTLIANTSIDECVLFYLKCTILHNKNPELGGAGTHRSTNRLTKLLLLDGGVNREELLNKRGFHKSQNPITLSRCGLTVIEFFSPHPSTEKSSSLPGSSRELAEIFGTSDDEEDMGFPFSLGGVGKSFPDLPIPDGRVSEFFLNSINALNVPGSVADSGLVGGAVAGAAEKSVTSDEKGAELPPPGEKFEDGAGRGEGEGGEEVKSASGGEGVKVAGTGEETLPGASNGAEIAEDVDTKSTPAPAAKPAGILVMLVTPSS